MQSDGYSYMQTTPGDGGHREREGENQGQQHELNAQQEQLTSQQGQTEQQELLREDEGDEMSPRKDTDKDDWPWVPILTESDILW